MVQRVFNVMGSFGGKLVGKSAPRAAAVLAGVLIAGAMAQPAAAFSSGNPRDVTATHRDNGLTATLKTDKDGKPYILDALGEVKFSTEFFDCDSGKLNCASVIYTASLASGGSEPISLAAINAWNRWTVMCPSYKDEAGAPNLWYGLRTTPSDTAQTVQIQLAEWKSCLTDYQGFLSDPDGWAKKH
jgi:hypothetical protein